MREALVFLNVTRELGYGNSRPSSLEAEACTSAELTHAHGIPQKNRIRMMCHSTIWIDCVHKVTVLWDAQGYDMCSTPHRIAQP